MSQLSKKQQLALKRGQFRRHFTCCKGLLGYVWFNREELCLSIKERAKIQQAYLILCDLDDDYVETGVEMGLKRKTLKNIEII